MDYIAPPISSRGYYANWVWRKCSFCSSAPSNQVRLLYTTLQYSFWCEQITATACVGSTYNKQSSWTVCLFMGENSLGSDLLILDVNVTVVTVVLNSKLTGFVYLGNDVLFDKLTNIVVTGNGCCNFAVLKRRKKCATKNYSWVLTCDIVTQ